MTVPLGYGIDVSHHNSPDWEALRGQVDFVIVRAAFGTTLDEKAKEHVRCAREIGAKVGLYIFFRSIQPEADQFMALYRVAEDCKIGPGDIVPALDIEDDPISKKSPDKSWSLPCQQFMASVYDEFGSGLVYVTQRVWSMMDRPEWLLHCPLWCACYRDGPPATPAGMPATIHQHRVNTFVPNGPAGAPEPPPPGTIDQNRLLLPLPLIGYQPSEEDRARVRALVAENLRRAVQEEELAPETPRLT